MTLEGKAQLIMENTYHDCPDCFGYGFHYVLIKDKEYQRTCQTCNGQRVITAQEYEEDNQKTGLGIG